MFFKFVICPACIEQKFFILIYLNPSHFLPFNMWGFSLSLPQYHSYSSIFSFISFLVFFLYFYLEFMWSSSLSCKVGILLYFSSYLKPYFPSISSSLFFLAMPWGGILVPHPGMKLLPLAVEPQSLNHWTAREVPPIALKNLVSPQCFIALYLSSFHTPCVLLSYLFCSIVYLPIGMSVPYYDTIIAL